VIRGYEISNTVRSSRVGKSGPFWRFSSRGGSTASLNTKAQGKGGKIGESIPFWLGGKRNGGFQCFGGSHSGKEGGTQGEKKGFEERGLLSKSGAFGKERRRTG